MKTLDASSLHSGIDEIDKNLQLQDSELQQLDASIKDFLSMKDSFEGKGGDAIRSFYTDCHIPFITYYRSAIQSYREQLSKSKAALTSMEPERSGYISESFLQNELEDGLIKAKELTADLTKDTNSVIQSVQDIVKLPSVDESEFISAYKKADTERELTLEKLNEYDIYHSRSLNSVKQDVASMDQYVQQVQGLFKNKELSVSTYQAGSLREKLTVKALNSQTNTNKNSEITTVSTGGRAANILTAFKENQVSDEHIEAKENEYSIETALKEGFTSALPPVAIIAALHKSGVVKIKYTKKKNHIVIDFNKDTANYLKGKKGPEWIRNFVNSINSISGQNSQIIKKKKQIEKDLKRGMNNVEKYKDTRTIKQKVKGFLVGKVTKNMQLKDFLKSKLVKYSDGSALIEKKRYKSIAAKAAGKAGLLGEAAVGFFNLWDQFAKNDRLKGVKEFEANGRAVGEEINNIAGAAAGASAGAYLGAAAGTLTGPFAPIGMAVGAAAGGAIGASVGKWVASKTTKKWFSNAGAAIGKKVFGF